MKITRDMRLAAHDAGMAALKRRKRPAIPSGDMVAIVTAVFKSAGFELEDFLSVTDAARPAR